MMHRSKSSHIGTCFSTVEILLALYFSVLRFDAGAPNDPARDRFLMSKGHGSAALYAVLAERELIPMEWLDRYYCDDGKLPGHLDRLSSPWIDTSAGSLGHGLSIGLGMALAANRKSLQSHVYVLLGDGECNEGSVWEAVMLASHLKLRNITAIVDYNRIQSFGMTNEVINQENLADRWGAFGWDVREVQGHDFESLLAALYEPSPLPRAIIAHTVKGKGVSFMENRLEWHYKSPNEEQLQAALRELEQGQ